MPQLRVRPPKVGLVLPIFEEAMAGATPRWANLNGIARLAEAAGFDQIDISGLIWHDIAIMTRRS